MVKRIQVNTSLVAFKYANDVFKGLDHEELWILYLTISFGKITSGEVTLID